MKTRKNPTTNVRPRDGTRIWAAISLALGLGLAGPACHDSSSGGGTSLAEVSGQVVDDRGDPVPSARIEVEGTSLETTTDANGYFVLTVPEGGHTLLASTHGVLLCELCFEVSGSRPQDLGMLQPGRDSGCGGPHFCAGDLDCDGIPDEVELQGWQVFVVLGDGTYESRSCTSDPARADTDGDGLTDVEEYAARTDPQRRDTDGDALSDFGELNSYKSNPCMVDSDLDSRGPDGLSHSDPNLWDGFELRYLGTSPTLADTDGDGMTDWEEVHTGGTNPLLADLPALRLELHGDPTLVLNIFDLETQRQDRVESGLERETASHTRTDTESTKMSIENTVKIHTETEAGTSNWPPSFNAKITTDTEFKHGYFTETSSSWTEGSVQESQRAFEEKTGGERRVRYDDGLLWLAMKVVNQSDLTFKVRDLRVTAYRMGAGGSFAPVGNLVAGTLEAAPPDGNGWSALSWAPTSQGEFILGPSAEFTELVGADHLPAQIMRALVANPTALMFEVGSYSLFQLDEFGIDETVNFAVLGEDVVQRSGLVVIDPGNGSIERHMIATNVYRYPDGSSRGVPLLTALRETVGLDVETALEVGPADPRSVLVRIGTTATYVNDQYDRIRGFWLVGGTGTQFDGEGPRDFEDILLFAGERISLTFVEDSDGEGIFDREEYLLGTEPGDPDSDGDGLNDFEESKLGWEVAVQNLLPYTTYSDPRFPDVDGDYLTDSSEFHLGTDPYLKDTDGDLDADSFDAFPLAPPCLGGGPLLLASWWDGTAEGTLARDQWTLDERASDGTLSDPLIASELAGEPVFKLNPLPDQRDHFIDVPSAGLQPLHEYTLSTWVHWVGTATGEAWSAILSNGPMDGPNFALSVGTDGTLRHTLFRRVHRKCWFNWFGSWDDGSCADSGYDKVEQLDSAAGVLPPGEWAHVVATFGGETMRLYVDGSEVRQRTLVSEWTSGLYKYRDYTEHLITSSLPLRLGGDPDSAPTVGPFRGFLDEVQYFDRGLNADEVRQLYLLGTCRPSHP